MRADLGDDTQPIFFIGLPVVAVPLKLSAMLIDVPLIGRPWPEALPPRAARMLEQAGVTQASIAGTA